jgi:hypothetical protein
MELALNLAHWRVSVVVLLPEIELVLLVLVECGSLL